MPMTPDEAAKLTEEEEEMLTELDEGLTEVIQATFNPTNPNWMIRLPQEDLFGTSPGDLGLPEGSIVDFNQRLKYLKSVLSSRFEEKGWILLFKDEEDVYEITPKKA